MPYGRKRLDIIQAEEIRHLYSSGSYTQKQLAKRFSISQALVCKIVNNKIHKSSFKIGGEAEVKMGFKYGN